jgi:hypothetical protein
LNDEKCVNLLRLFFVNIDCSSVDLYVSDFDKTFPGTNLRCLLSVSTIIFELFPFYLLSSSAFIMAPINNIHLNSINTLSNHYLHTKYRIKTLLYQTIIYIYIREVCPSMSACGLYKEITTACSCHSRSHHWIIGVFFQ